MTVKLSTGFRVGQAITSSMKVLLDGGLVRIYSGTVPETADAALGGATLLCEISDGGTGDPLNWEATAPGGVLSKAVSENWTGNNVLGGTPTFFRYVKVADTGDASTTAVRIQGTAGALGSDMYISTLPLVLAAPQSFSLFQLAIPEQ
jgi:hypothetical protein